MREKVRQACRGSARAAARAGSLDYTKFLTADRFAVFLFHGVITQHQSAVRNYIRKHIDRNYFADILQRLLKCGTAVTLSQVVAAAHGETVLPERAFVVTFDDGFANNYTVAAPVLEEMSVPAIFFVTTSFIDQNAASWIDMVEQAVASVPQFGVDLPQYGLQGSFNGPAQKIGLLKEIRRRVFEDKAIDPNKFAKQLASHIEAGKFEPDADLDQKMSWDQVRSLAANPLFSVGGHSHTHAILSYLGQNDLSREINISLELLEEHTGRLVKYYAYPQGLDFCYSDQVIVALKQRGIVCCPTAEEGVNRVGDDLFRLKRIMVT